jgi:hypothetical protein
MNRSGGVISDYRWIGWIRESVVMTARAYRAAHLFTKRIPSPKEETLHIQLVAILRLCMREDVIWYHCPNGGNRDHRTAEKLKAMGVLPGVADLQFHWAEWDMRVLRDITPEATVVGKVRKVLHLELKVGTREQSDAQIAFGLAMRLLGDEYFVVRSIDEAIAILGERGLIRSGVHVGGRSW